MSPASLLLFLIATASAALAHLLWGRRWLQLPLFWLAAFAGCLVVYALGLRLPLQLPAPGRAQPAGGDILWESGSVLASPFSPLSPLASSSPATFFLYGLRIPATLL